MQIPILYEDEEIIVCHKPSGMPVQTKSFMQQDMENLLKNYRLKKGEPPYIGVVHRLDQPVEGVLVFAKTDEAAAELSRQMAAKLADKYYYAMVQGIPKKKKDILENYLLRDGKNNVSSVVLKSLPGAKRAELSYEVLEEKNGYAVLRVRLVTGRHHQIRVQLSHAGFPIVGDKKYNFQENITPSGKYLALCAYKISFRHPKTHKKLDFQIDKPYTLE